MSRGSSRLQWTSLTILLTIALMLSSIALAYAQLQKDLLPTISISGASLAIPETLKDEVSSYRSSIPKYILESLPIELPREQFILATPESLYLVLADEADSGLAEVEGWRLPLNFSFKDMSMGVVVARSVTFKKEGVPATIGEILANPDDYEFKLVKVSAYRRQTSILYDPDEGPHVEFPITIGYLTEEPVRPLNVVRELLGRARDFTLKLDGRLIRDLLQVGGGERLWLFNLEYDYWYDGRAVTNGIVIPIDHPVFELIRESMPTMGKFVGLGERVVLYDVKTDIPCITVPSVRELKANYEKYLGEVVRLEANCCGGYISVQEVIEENTPCGRDHVYVEGIGCVNIVIDVRLEGLVAWSDVSATPKREELLLVVGVSSYHQDEQFVEVDGVFELIGKVVSTKQISESLPEGIALVICRARKVGEVDFERLAQTFRDEVRDRAGELYWALQDIYPYATRPDIPMKVPRRVFKPIAPIFVRGPRDVPEIHVERNVTICIGIVRPETPISLDIANSHITNIYIALKEVVENATIYFEKLPHRPPNVPSPPGLVYAYYEVGVSISKESFKGANITFWVSREWLTANGMTANNVVMLRYHADAWEELTTRCIGENATYFKFVAEAPYLSIFAITAREATFPTTGVEGYVRDEVGGPISDVKVIALSKVTAERVAEARTDEMGHYLMELPPGEYMLAFSATGYVDKSSDVSVRSGEVSRVDVVLKKASAEFSEDWYGVKFEIAIVTEEPWRVGAEVVVEVWITVIDMGGNREVEFRQLELGLVGTGATKAVPLNVETNVGGTVYNGSIALTVLNGFGFMKPGSEESYYLQVVLEGSTIDRSGIELPSITMELTAIKVYAPPSPVSLSFEAPDKVIIGEEFEVRVEVRNDGEYPVHDVRVELLVPSGTSAVSPTDWREDVLNPGEEAIATFRLKAESARRVNIVVSLSYSTLWDYSIFESRTLGSVLIGKIPTSISISVTPSRVTVGEKVTIKGSIEPAMSAPLRLTITEPDGVTRTMYGTSAPNGTFGFEVELIKKGRYSFVVSYGGGPMHEASISNEVYAEAEERKACIIATAAYGSELHPHVQFLRSFRDDFVLRTFAGSNFMEVFNAWYYSFSPHIASLISTCEHLRAATRATLYPLIGILHLGAFVSYAFSFNSEVSVITAGIIISALIGLVYFTPPTMLATCLIERLRGPLRTRLKELLIAWTLSIMLVAVAELVASPTLMKVSSGALVLSTIALVAWITALKASRRLLAHHGSKP